MAVRASRRTPPAEPAAAAPLGEQLEREAPLFLRAAQQIRDAIDTGRLPAGSRLPNEHALAEQFGISRASLREALSCLQFIGYLEPRQGSGTVVRDRDSRAEPADCPDEDPGIADVLEARLIIEPPAVALAARNHRPGAIRELEQLLQGMRLVLEQPSLHADTDRHLHLTVLRLCPNVPLRETAERLVTLTQRQLARLGSQGWADERQSAAWLAHHEGIVRAVVEGDTGSAEAATRSHLLSVLAMASTAKGLRPAERARLKSLRLAYRDRSTGTGDGSTGDRQ